MHEGKVMEKLGEGKRNGLRKEGGCCQRVQLCLLPWDRAEVIDKHHVDPGIKGHTLQ